MSRLVKAQRPTMVDLLWSGWPFDTMPELVDPGLMPLRIEEYADGDDWVIRAELPGIDPERDAEVSVDNGVLTVAAERREESTEGDEGKPGYRSEFRYGSYRRSLRLPPDVTVDDVTATYADGILEVRVPRSVERPKPAKVAVTRA
jgi:HSP20 family protein